MSSSALLSLFRQHSQYKHASCQWCSRGWRPLPRVVVNLPQPQTGAAATSSPALRLPSSAPPLPPVLDVAASNTTSTSSQTDDLALLVCLEERRGETPQPHCHAREGDLAARASSELARSRPPPGPGMHARFRPSSELKMAAAASVAARGGALVASSRPSRRMGGCRAEPPRFLVVSCDARTADVYSSLVFFLLFPSECILMID